MATSWEMRVVPPGTVGPPSPGEWNGNREANRIDCVRTVHKQRNLLAHAPDALQEEVSADYTDMIYAATPKEVETRRRAFLRKWRLRCPAVVTSLEEAGERLFSFLRLPSSQWKSARTTNAIERLHEAWAAERTKAPDQDPDCAASAETAVMLFWALLASGQITMRKVDGWKTLAKNPPPPSRLTWQPDHNKSHPAGDAPIRPLPHSSRRCTILLRSRVGGRPYKGVDLHPTWPGGGQR